MKGCSYKPNPDRPVIPGPEQICGVSMDQLMQSDCNAENDYGFSKGTPCMLLKLNRVR